MRDRARKKQKRDSDKFDKNGFPKLGTKATAVSVTSEPDLDTRCHGRGADFKRCTKQHPKDSLYCGSCRCVVENCTNPRAPRSTHCEEDKRKAAKEIAARIRELASGT